MKNQNKYFLVSILTLLLSTPVGRFVASAISFNQGLYQGEYNILLKGCIHSFMIIGVLVFIAGLVSMFIEKK